MSPVDPWIIDDLDQPPADERPRPSAPTTVREPGVPRKQEQAPDRGVEIVDISPESDAIRI